MDTISKRTRNAVYDTHLHLVFVVKDRKQVLSDEMLSSLEGYFRELCATADAELEEFNGEADHVHLLVSLPPRLAVATLVNSLKGVSSRYLQRDYDSELSGKLWGKRLWSRSYYVGTAGGDPLDSLKQYIQNQDRPKKV